MEPTPIAALMQQYGLKNVDLTRRFGIPSRTVEAWKAGYRKAPDYVMRMMEDLLRQENKEVTKMAHNFEIKEKIVREGGSNVFKNWNQFGVSMEDFIENLRWLCEDPSTDRYNPTRAIAFEGEPYADGDQVKYRNGKIVQLRRQRVDLFKIDEFGCKIKCGSTFQYYKNGVAYNPIAVIDFDSRI